MSAQDVAALATCAVALAWLLWRLVLTHGPTTNKPHVTTRSLLRSTRARRAARGAAPAADRGADRSCH